MGNASIKAMLLATTVAIAGALPMTAFAADAAAAPAATELSEVIVTATKTGATPVQRTALSVSVVSAAALDRSGASNVKDLVALTPNLSVAQVTTSAAIYIRGIGSNNVFNGSDPDVTVEVDGVYLARAYAQFADFLDVDRVEVLRGPQGTLYGRNAVGGVLNVISTQPSDTFRAKEQVTVGDYNLIQNQAFISGPIVAGKLQGSLSTNYQKHDGYFANIAPGGHAAADADRQGVKGQLRFEINDSLTATTRADYTQLKEYGESYDHLLTPVAYAPLASSLIGNFHKVALDAQQLTKQITQGVSEEVNYRAGDHISFKSITAWRAGEYKLLNDTDGTEIFVNLGIQQEHSTQFSQELSLNARYDNFEAVAGLYYFHETQRSRVTSLLPPSPATPTPAAGFNDVNPSSHAQSQAAFAQGTYHLTPTVKITAGVRYTANTKHADQFFDRHSESTYPVMGPETPGFPIILSTTRDFHALTPKFGIDWQAADNVFVYGSATKGYKSGGTNYAARTLSAFSFAPESIWSYEAGVRTEWFDHRLRLNATAFDYDYTGLQVQSLIGPGNVAIGNAATAKVKGLELEAVAKPTTEWLFTANYSVLDARYGKFAAASVPGALVPFVNTSPHYSAGPPATYDASGNYLNAAPKSSWSVTGQYTRDLGAGEAFARAEYYWQDRVFYDPSNAAIMSQGAYGLLNLGLGWNSADRKWSAQIIAKNVTNQQYLITVAAVSVAPAGLSGAPRTVMFRLGRTW